MNQNLEYDWEELFTEEQMEEALDYYYQGKAKKLTEEHYGFSVTVRGHRNYRVRIYEDKTGIRSMECTCDLRPGEMVCKHMAAALMLIEDAYDYSPVTRPPRRKQDTAAARLLPPGTLKARRKARRRIRNRPAERALATGTPCPALQL